MVKLPKNAAIKPKSLTLQNALYSQAQKDLKRYYAVSDQDRKLSRPPFNDSVIAAEDIASALSNAQLQKCAYCESPLEGNPASFVSHYRPLSNAIIDLADKQELHDRYAWFAYEWQNLLLICTDCNQSKLNTFPLAGSVSKPFSTWKAAQSIERPILLNPFTDRVEDHVTFDSRGKAIAIDEVGRINIQLLNLNRTKLIEARREAIALALKQIEHVRKSSDRNEQRRLISEICTLKLPYYGAIASIFKWIFDALQVGEQVRRTRGLALADQILIMLNEYDFDAWRSALDLTDRLDRRFSDDLSKFVLDLDKFSYLSKISVSGFKGIDQCNIGFSGDKSERSSRTAPCTMLLGENAAGKSTILQAISLATMPAARRRSSGVMIKKMLPVTSQTDRTYEKNLTVRAEFEDGGVAEIKFRDGRLRMDGKATGPFLGYGARRFFIAGQYANIKTSRNRSLFDDGASLQDPSLWLANAPDTKYEAAARALHSLLTLKTEQWIERDSSGVYVRSPGSKIPVGNLSDGYKTIFALSVDIMREILEDHGGLEYAQAVVLIDEIENHLHPSWKKKLMSSLRAAMPRVQFISSTHDPLCLRGMKDGEVRVLYRSGENTIDVLHDLPPISTLRIEQILTSEYFGLSSTEDDSQLTAVNILARYADRDDASLSDTERADRDKALREYSGTSMIGDSVDRQIMAEALGNHVKKFANKNFYEKSLARKESVQRIMDVLERALNRD